MIGRGETEGRYEQVVHKVIRIGVMTPLRCISLAYLVQLGDIGAVRGVDERGDRGLEVLSTGRACGFRGVSMAS